MSLKTTFRELKHGSIKNQNMVYGVVIKIQYLKIGSIYFGKILDTKLTIQTGVVN